MRFDLQENINFFIQNAHLKTTQEWVVFLNCNRNLIGRWRRKYNVKTKKANRKHSQETKIKMSEKRKEWMAKNSDRHPWKKADKFKSEPCEKVKLFLTELVVPFIAEFSPEIEGRFFSIDIALPDKKIALEINGNQHYNRDGTLKSYYQERHDLLTSSGWNVFEIHYSACFNLEKWKDFASQIINSPVVENFDYFNYQPNQVKPKALYYCQCGELKKEKKAIRCVKCANYHRRVVARPSYNQLTLDFQELKSFVQVGKKYGVSDNCVRKWYRRRDSNPH